MKRIMETGMSLRLRHLLHRRKAAAAIAAAAALLALAGCAGTTAASVSVSTSPTELRIVNEALLGTLDPTACGNTECRRVEYLAYGYLTQFPSGKPELAQSLTAAGGDTTWTAVLRPGLKFSDGRPLTSADVVASFERYLRPPFKGTLDVMKNIVSVTAQGSSAVVFKLAQPDADFPQSLTINTAAIYPAGKLSASGFFARPVSAGPYEITAANLAKGAFTLTANPHYYGAKPEVRTIVFTTVSDGATRLAQVESGQVDYAKSIPANLLKDLPKNLRVEPVNFPGGMIHLVFNDGAGSKSVTTDVRVRQAINLAVNRQQIVSVALSGYMAPLYGLPWIDQPALAPPVSRDVRKAKQLLHGTACQNGCTIRLLDIPDFNWQLPLVTTVVQQNLADIGITVQLVNTPIATLSKVAPDSWDGAVLDPGYDVDTDSSIATGALTAWQWWGTTPSFPDLAALAQQLAVAPASEDAQLKSEINAAFAKDMPWVPLTTLTFLDVSRLPESVIASPIGWKLNIG
jgi:peptide/nickel transport system substrate-binding protein